MKRLIVVGGGPAGMMAAINGAENGAAVTLLEKMPQLGKKLLLTGKGRCNFTNVAEVPEIIKQFPASGAFLYSSLRALDNKALMAFMGELGVAAKVERGGRVFPESDRAADVLAALQKRLKQVGVQVRLNSPAQAIFSENGRAAGVKLATGEMCRADVVILATGGASYPGTGSTGDGYAMAAKVGHSLVPIFPSLVPLETEETWVKGAQGLSLRNVRLTLLADGKKVQDLFGEMLFTHFGVSGPIVLSLSRKAAQFLLDGSMVELGINLKPALTPEQLEARVLRDFHKFSRQQLKNALGELLPQKLIAPVLDQAFLTPDKPVHSVTQAERRRLIETLRGLILTVTKTRPLAEAIVTAGGVNLKEINPKTMESKILPGLYFAGEIMDIDAFTGGYNLQAAFSTGAAAGRWSAV
ncbi:MAG: NAD(P)/FAD-dependent oxidoreductase [Selenomonadaceae bacterium]|nr:NAD(P)/FAD-dependent oxidoreductase [Selenomonadaceae bacterium]